MLLSMDEVRSARGNVINGVDSPDSLSVDSTEPLNTIIDAEKSKEAESSEAAASEAGKKEEKKSEEGKVNDTKAGAEENKTGETEDAKKEEKNKASEEKKSTDQEKDDEKKHSSDEDLPLSVQKRFDKLTKIRRVQEREIAYKDQKIKDLEERLAKVEQKVVAEDKPKPEDFDNEAEFIEALTDWKVKQAIGPTVKKMESEKEDEKIKQEISEKLDGVDDMMAEGAEKYDDFEESVTGKFPLTKETVEVVLSMDAPSDVLYYISKNPDVANKLAGLTGKRLIIEVSKLEGKLSEESITTKKVETKKEEQVKPKISNAPPPLNPVKANANLTVDPNKMSMKEYRKWRQGEN